MKSRLISGMVLILMILAVSGGGIAAAGLGDVAAGEVLKLKEPPLQVQFNGSIIDTPPYMGVINGQVMVPLRWSAELLGATSVEWDAAVRAVTITTPQDFYNLEKLRSYVGALQNPIDEVKYNYSIWPLPDKAGNIELTDQVPNRPWILNLEEFKLPRPGVDPLAPRDQITINITSQDGVYQHSSAVYSLENHQGHYYLPMDWLGYLFNARVSYDDTNNILSIMVPDLLQIKSAIERIETLLIPDSADEAVKLWGRGLQTRNGALQYAALSPQLRKEADNSPYVRETYWVTGASSPQVGAITIESRNDLSDTMIEYSISFPEVFSGQTHAIANERMVVEKININGRPGWFITQMLESSGYGIIENKVVYDEANELADSEKLLGYIKAYDDKSRVLTFDEIEWITQEDTQRISELGLDANLDFPNGFYIYNENDQNSILKIATNVKIYLIVWNGFAKKHTETDLNVLIERMAEYQAPYHLTLKDGVVVEILEQYVP